MTRNPKSQTWFTCTRTRTQTRNECNESQTEINKPKPDEQKLTKLKKQFFFFFYPKLTQNKKTQLDNPTRKAEALIPTDAILVARTGLTIVFLLETRTG